MANTTIDFGGGFTVNLDPTASPYWQQEQAAAAKVLQPAMTPSGAVPPQPSGFSLANLSKGAGLALVIAVGAYLLLKK